MFLNSRVNIVFKKNIFYIYILNKLFFKQIYLKSPYKYISNGLYTYLYVCLILYRFGLIIIF